MGTEPTPPISFIPPGKIKCFITGRLRKETPEEHVRQRVSRSLVHEYGYAKEDMELEFSISVGSDKKRVDIAVFQRGSDHTQENIRLVVETKSEDTKPTDRDNGVGQLKSYLAACPNAKWGLWVGSELRAYEIVQEKGQRKAIEVADIPPAGKKEPARLTFNQLLPAREGLRELFKRSHNYIYANQGLQKEQAFHELLKLIFCKVHDEQTTSAEMRFDIAPDEARFTLAQKRLRQRIEDLFEQVKERYPYIFDRDEKIKLNDRVLAYIVSEIRRYSLLRTETDVKGNAYEEIVGPNLRGDRGEFFTPRNVCKMAAQVAFATYPRDRWLELKILDPACGTGGFLVEVKTLWRDLLFAQERAKWGPGDKSIERAYERLQDVANRNLYGIDINPALARAAQMNVLMHGGKTEDGAPNIFGETDSLLPAGEWRQRVQRKITFGTFDVVLTNPPFGAKAIVDDPHILDQFEIAALSGRAGLPPEQLFIERCWQLLKTGGRLAIVLPDSILSNPGLLFIRSWLLKNCRVIASIDLPTETFEAFGGTGTQTSVLVVQRRTSEEIKVAEAGAQEQYEIFMALCRTMGYDRRGNDRWLRTPEGEIIVEQITTTITTLDPERGVTVYEPKKEEQRVRDDEVSEVPCAFESWVEENEFLPVWNG